MTIQVIHSYAPGHINEQTTILIYNFWRSSVFVYEIISLVSRAVWSSGVHLAVP